GFGPGGPGGFGPGGPGGFGPGGPGGFGPGGPGGFGPGGFWIGGPWLFPPAGPQATVTVLINGGRAFPNITEAYRIPFRPGLTIYQALAETGVVSFSFNGQINSVSGVPIGGNTSYQLILNGRVIPASLLSFPLQRNDSVALELFLSPVLREDEIENTSIEN
ncbi:hypothetical protein AB4Z50_10135, partial [Paenibacillus sp. 2TAB26]|uniref:hypothetical protein n=1 Tax=Paenibacillus sp. 2TAB26 TaxID=3233005 RepID=UPI003F980DC9